MLRKGSFPFFLQVIYIFPPQIFGTTSVYVRGRIDLGPRYDRNSWFCRVSIFGLVQSRTRYLSKQSPIM